VDSNNILVILSFIAIDSCFESESKVVSSVTFKLIRGNLVIPCCLKIDLPYNDFYVFSLLFFAQFQLKNVSHEKSFSLYTIFV
jgi:hypothetical protein